MTDSGVRANGKPAVLVVDNDRGNLLALQGALDALDCRVIAVGSGAEAVEQTRVEEFAAILMDVNMPGLDGYAAASFIRQNPRSASIPILFISARDDIDVAHLTRRYGNTGQVDSLQKPYDVDALRYKVTWWLDRFLRDRQMQELEHTVDSVLTEARTKDDVLAKVAHDLKGPLFAISLDAERVRRQMANDPSDPKVLPTLERHFDLVKRNVDRMATLVDDLIDSARIESGKLQLNLARHDFADIIAQAVDLLRPIADQKMVHLERTCRDTDYVVECDRDRMLQVLSNLAGNALKFTPAAGRVRIDATCSADSLVVAVRDDGPGIAADQLPYIFEKYWQGNRAGAAKGLGLGLAIAKEILVAHGGRIWVESQLGEGSHFFFSIPRSRAQ
jgi:signal transduction histidine kinase